MSDFWQTPLGGVLSILAGTAVGVGPFLLLYWGLTRRDARRWQREAERRQQLWDLQDQIWRESLPDWQREAVERAARTRAAIRHEARRRLGLPEEEPPA
jgi:hypothetical protein